MQGRPDVADLRQRRYRPRRDDRSAAMAGGCVAEGVVAAAAPASAAFLTVVPAARDLIVFDIGILQHLLPPRRLVAYEGGKLLRRAGYGEIAGLVELLPHVGLRKNVH